METKVTTYRKLGGAFFVVGTLIGVLLSVGAVWADLEAAFYGFTKLTNDRLNTLSCPAYMTTHETGVVSIRLTNTTDRPVNQLVRAQFSAPATLISVDEGRDMPSGATEVFFWTVDASNLDLDNFIFASVYRFATYPVSAQQSMCGIYVLDIPFVTGLQFVIIMSLLSISGMAAGWWLWEKSNRPMRDHSLETSRAMKFMLGLVPVTMLVSMIGSWVMGGMLLVICVLMGAITLKFFVRS